MTKHTPTPWQALPDENGNETYVVGPKDQAVADCMMGYGVTDDANAAFIVKAVNNHKALVKALEVLLAEATSFSVSGVYFDEDCMGHKGPTLARQALDAVGGSSQP